MNTTIRELQFVTEIAKHVHWELGAIVEGKLVRVMEVSPVKVCVTRLKTSVDYCLDFTAARMGDTNFFGLARLLWRAFSLLPGRFARRLWGSGSRAMNAA